MIIWHTMAAGLLLCATAEKACHRRSIIYIQVFIIASLQTYIAHPDIDDLAPWHAAISLVSLLDILYFYDFVQHNYN